MSDETQRPQDILAFAAERQAYVVAGHIPFAFGKTRGPGLAVLLSGDPAMRRPYVVVEQPNADAHEAPSARQRAARAVTDFLTTPAGQLAVARAGQDGSGRQWVLARTGIPL